MNNQSNEFMILMVSSTIIFSFLYALYLCIEDGRESLKEEERQKSFKFGMNSC
jgi:hypothetical protein